MICEICGANYNLVEFQNEEGETILLCDSCFQEQSSGGTGKIAPDSDGADWDEDEDGNDDTDEDISEIEFDSEDDD